MERACQRRYLSRAGWLFSRDITDRKNTHCKVDGLDWFTRFGVGCLVTGFPLGSGGMR